MARIGNVPTLLPKGQEEARGLWATLGLLLCLELVFTVVMDNDHGFSLRLLSC